MKERLKQLLYAQQEEGITHMPISEEFNYYRIIAEGKYDVNESDFDATPTEHMGKLSNNPLRNTKYHLIVMTAMITRFCIENGLDEETAYTMSDYFINNIDRATTEKSLSMQKQSIILEFNNTMKNFLQKRPPSYHITRAMDYIQKNITSTMRPRDVAASIDISEDYLSRLFKKEMNLTLSQYIIKKKCDTAKYMLINSSATCSEISTFLGFSSSSHFIKRFKEINNITPDSFRSMKKSQALSSIANNEI